MRVLIDTNVILDALIERKPYKEASNYVFLHTSLHTVDMFVSAKQFSDIYYVYRRYSLDRKSTLINIKKLAILFKICDMINEDVINATNSKINDFEDALLEAVAYRNKYDFIVTRNINNFKLSKVRAILPEDFIRMIEA